MSLTGFALAGLSIIPSMDKTLGSYECAKMLSRNTVATFCLSPQSDPCQSFPHWGGGGSGFARSHRDSERVQWAWCGRVCVSVTQ